MSTLKEQINELKQEILTSVEMWDNSSAKEKNSFVLKIVTSNFPHLSLGDAKRLVLGLQEKMQIGTFMPVNVHEALDIIKEYGDIHEIPQKICEFIGGVYDGENVIAEFINTFGYFVFVHDNENTELLITLIEKYEMSHINYGGDEDKYMNVGLYNAFIDLLNYFQTDIFNIKEVDGISNKPSYKSSLTINGVKYDLGKIFTKLVKERVSDFGEEYILSGILENIGGYNEKAYTYLQEYYNEEFGQTDDVEFDKEIFHSYYPTSTWLTEKQFNKIEDLYNQIKYANE